MMWNSWFHMMRLGCLSTPVKRRQEVAMFRNTMPRYEVLSEDAMAKLDGAGGGW